MKASTLNLLDQLEEKHDWEQGQVYGGGGTRLSSTDTCRVCGLSRHWFSDRQNSVSDRYSFTDSNGINVTLRDAAVIKCC